MITSLLKKNALVGGDEVSLIEYFNWQQFPVTGLF
jgi:hypothetical protein